MLFVCQYFMQQAQLQNTYQTMNRSRRIASKLVSNHRFLVRLPDCCLVPPAIEQQDEGGHTHD